MLLDLIIQLKDLVSDGESQTSSRILEMVEPDGLQSDKQMNRFVHIIGTALHSLQPAAVREVEGWVAKVCRASSTGLSYKRMSEGAGERTLDFQPTIQIG